MVHGGCGSIGCYAMTNAVIDEIWRLITAAFRSGQPVESNVKIPLYYKPSA